MSRLKNICDMIWLIQHGAMLDDNVVVASKRRANYLRANLGADYIKTSIGDVTSKELSDAVIKGVVHPIDASVYFIDKCNMNTDSICNFWKI